MAPLSLRDLTEGLVERDETQVLPRPEIPAPVRSAINELPERLRAIAEESCYEWTEVSWDDYLIIAGDRESTGLPGVRPCFTTALFRQSLMKLDMVPLGKDHGRCNSVPFKAATLFAAFQRFKTAEYINTTLRKTGEDDCQPDLSIYVGDGLPTPGNEVIDLDEFDPPNLGIEVAATSEGEDLGYKRMFYENLGIQEYWVIITRMRKLAAFAIADGRSGEIKESVVLPRLELAIVDEALRRTDGNDDAATTRWLIEKFSG